MGYFVWSNQRKKLVMIKTFTLAWLQVTLICLNTWQIANTHYIGALIVGFLISLIWTMNVGRVALSSWQTKLIYSFGAMCGTGTGLFLAQAIYQ